MPQFLNVDDLSTTSTKSLKFRGVLHHAQELTVQTYIDRLTKARAVEAASTSSNDTDTAESNLRRALELINEVFPTLTPEILGGVSMANLRVIIDFALSAPEDIEAEAVKRQADAANSDAAATGKE